MGGIPFDLGVAEDLRDACELGGVPPRRRSLWALGALALGFAIARGTLEWSGIPWLGVRAPTAAFWFGACQAALAFVLLTRGRVCRVLLFVAAVLFGGGWFTHRFEDAPERLDCMLRSVEGPAASSPMIATVRGRVMNAPELVTPRAGVLGGFARTPSSWVFRVQCDSLEVADSTVPTTGVVRVSIQGATGALSRQPLIGSSVRVTGEFRPIAPPLNPGEPDRRLLALQDGVVGRLIVPDETLIEQISAPVSVGGPWHRFVAWSRQRANAALGLGVESGKGTPDMGRALLSAMLLGAREPGADDVDAAFRRVGLVHLVAISGFNLAVLAWATGILVRFAGERGRLESIGVAAVLGLYLLIVPAESPILRAGVTVLAFLVTESLGRRYDRLTLLGWIACALLIWRPLDLWSLGFQLSFGIVGALVWMGRRVEGRLFGVRLRGVVSVGVPIGPRPGLLRRWWTVAWNFMWGKFKTACSASLLAWGVAAPVIMVHTGMFSPWAPISGLVALPLAVVTLCAGYGALMVGFVWPAAGPVLAGIAYWCAELLGTLVMQLDALPAASMQVPRISALWGAAAVGVVLYWFARGTWRSRGAWVLAGAMIVWFGGEAFFRSRLSSDVPLRIDAIAVGDGTCHLVRSGGESMLWDCGSSHPGFGLMELPRAVRSLGAYRVPAVVVTHANLDHFLCLPDVVEPLGVERVYLTRMFLEEAASRPQGAAAALIREIEMRHVRVIALHAGDSIQLGEVECRILSPAADETYQDANDTSLVGLFRVATDVGERRVLFTGDIGPGAIGRLVAAHPELEVDVLEAPHHGSAKPEAMTFVERVGAPIVIQSTGPQRLGDHRWDSVKHGRKWLTTASDGACWAEVRRDGGVQSGALRLDRAKR